MTTVLAPSPTRPAPKAKAKAKAAPNPESAKLNAALATLARMEVEGAPKLGPANRDTWAQSVAAWASDRMKLHAAITDAPSTFSRRCSDGIDRSARDLADYLCGIRFDAKGRRADLKTWASPK